MKRVTLVVMVFALVGALGLPQVEAAKEKANKTSCTQRISNIGSSGMDGIRQMTGLLLPVVQQLLVAGNETGAWHLTLNGVKNARHRGHVTVLKIQQTADHCVAKLERQGGDDPATQKQILQIRLAAAKTIAEVRLTTKRAVNSFFDIWYEIT